MGHFLRHEPVMGQEVLVVVKDVPIVGHSNFALELVMIHDLTSSTPHDWFKCLITGLTTQL